MARAGADAKRRPQRQIFHVPMRIVRGRPRLFACALAGAVFGALTPSAWQIVTRVLVGWDAALVLYLVMVGTMMARASGEDLRRRAQQTDEGRFAILIAGTLAAIISFGAIVAELGVAKDLQTATKAMHIALAAITIALSWFFLHFMFALHYANEYFFECDFDGDGEPDLRGGLHFPGNDDKEPTYVDFLYYAYTIGVAAQTADVETTSRGMRLVTLAHSIVSFFFNTAILALTINIAASLI